MNKKATIEWMTIAYHDLTSAQILFSVNHYTDSIGSDLQQAIEKLLKSPREEIEEVIHFSEDLFQRVLTKLKINHSSIAKKED